MAPQDAIDEFWQKFNTKTPGKAITILPQNVYAEKAGSKAAKGLVPSQNTTTSYDEAANICRSKVEQIVKECRRVNQKYRDPHFDIEFDLKWAQRDCLETLPIADSSKSTFHPSSVKRVGDIFDDPKFYINGPTANDVRQGRDGDCWLMAALCALSNKPGLIEKVCVAKDEAVGVYGFVFCRDGEWRSEIIDDKLYLTRADYDESFLERILWEDRERIHSEEDYRRIYQTNSGALYFAQCENPNETWLPLLEKAYAKAHGDFASIEGGWTGEGIEDLTGGVTTELFTTDILDKDYFWEHELKQVNKEFLFGCSTGLFRGWGERKGIMEGHAYSIMEAKEIDGHRLLLLKNPWGKGEWSGPWSDGSKEWTPERMMKLGHTFGNDGSFYISLEDLLRKMQSFDRTRIFSSDWSVVQEWTTLKISWVVDYHSTKFEITLDKPTSVVIVLSQLDDRYFRGLEGQYRFELSFRLHKAGDPSYIVRSHANYCMSRSVSAELDLEKGTYHVLLKIKATRDLKYYTVENVIRENCKHNRDKLFKVGMSYDLAHSKGRNIETEDEKKARKVAEQRKLEKEKEKMKIKLKEEKKMRRLSEVKKKRKQKARMERKRKRRQERNAKKIAEEKEKSGDSKNPTNNEDLKRPTDQEEKITRGTVVSVNKINIVAEAPTDEATDGDENSGSDNKAQVSMPIVEIDTPETGSDASVISNVEASKPQEKQAEIPSQPNRSGLRASSSSEALSPTTPSVKLNVPQSRLPPPPVSGCADCVVAQAPVARPLVRSRGFYPPPPPPMPPPGLPPPPFIDSDSDTDTEISSVASSEVSEALARERARSRLSRSPLPPSTPAQAAQQAEEDEDEFEKDPWNAVAVVGLRVYSLNAKVTMCVLRPKDWEEGTGLDVDDSNVDATIEEKKDGKAVGFRGSIGALGEGKDEKANVDAMAEKMEGIEEAVKGLRVQESE